MFGRNKKEDINTVSMRVRVARDIHRLQQLVDYLMSQLPKVALISKTSIYHSGGLFSIAIPFTATDMLDRVGSVKSYGRVCKDSEISSNIVTVEKVSVSYTDTTRWLMLDCYVRTSSPPSSLPQRLMAPCFVRVADALDMEEFEPLDWNRTIWPDPPKRTAPRKAVAK